MSKYVALQAILHNGRMHKPGETIDCADPSLAQMWLDNHAVEIIIPEQAHVSVEDAPEQTDAEADVEQTESGSEATGPDAERTVGDAEAAKADAESTPQPKLGRSARASK